MAMLESDIWADVIINKKSEIVLCQKEEQKFTWPFHLALNKKKKNLHFSQLNATWKFRNKIKITFIFPIYQHLPEKVLISIHSTPKQDEQASFR